MKKLKKILKWSAIILGPLFVIYTLIWFSITVTLSNILNKEYARKDIEISDAAIIKFGAVTYSGFPFAINIELHNFIEENNNTIVSHSSPLILGYNVITQTLSSYYKGESIARYKPVEAGFGVKVTGEYEVHAFVPLNSALFKIAVLKHKPFEIVNYINDLNIKSTNVDIKDIVDNSMMIDDANLHIRLGVKHHKYYTTLEELLSAIPQDYYVSVNASTKNSGEVKRFIPFSIVYLAYLPFNFHYEFDANIHTDSKEFEIKEILEGLQIKTNKMNYYSDVQNVSSKLNFESNLTKDRDHEFKFDYLSNIRFLEGFSKYIAKSIYSLSKRLPPDSSASVFKDYISSLNLDGINIDTKEVPIKLGINAILTKHPNNKIEANLENLAVYFENTGFDLKSYISTGPKTEALNGVISIVDWQKMISYMAKSYFAIRNLPDFEIYTGDFWGKLYIDLIESIANDINRETSTLTLKFNITEDVLKSEIGKFSWPEVKLLYYAKLFEHTLAVCKNHEEALQKFRMIIPAEINDPKILEKVIKPR